MIFQHFEQLCRAIMDRLDQRPKGLSDEEDAAWIRGDAELARLAELARVYLHAGENPPDGVIGVGAITYAERKMVEAQQ